MLYDRLKKKPAADAGAEADRPGSIQLPTPYLLFLGDATMPGYDKTAQGLRAWAPEKCIGEYALPDARVSTGLPHMPPAEAARRGARALVIGIANDGGVIADKWIPTLLDALEHGLDLVSGMHMRLADQKRLRDTAARLGRRLIDVRTPPAEIAVASGRKRTGKRLLTVGTDCALGKKYSALAIERGFRARGIDATFRATGQTGIMIAGSGIPIDSVVADFAAGAAEQLSPDAAPGHWDVIEGQGSLFHPSYAGVSLALLHGSQPDVIVVCHDPSRTCILGHPELPLPPLSEVIELNLRLGARTNAAIRCGGVTFNTSSLTEGAAALLLDETSDHLGMPVADPIRGGDRFERLLDRCLG